MRVSDSVSATPMPAHADPETALRTSACPLFAGFLSAAACFLHIATARNAMATLATYAPLGTKMEVCPPLFRGSRQVYDSTF